MAEYFLGIDVGFSKTKATTGLCLITLERNRLEWHCRNTQTDKEQRLADLKRLIPCRTKIAAIGIDGPLASGLQIVDRYRSAEALLSRGSFQKRCKPGQTNSPIGRKLHLHATKLAKMVTLLQSEGYLSIDAATHPSAIHESRIVETFPDAFLSAMLRNSVFCQTELGRRKFDRFWNHLLKCGFPDNLIELVSPQAQMDQCVNAITDHDQRAAFVCALAALCVSKGRYVAVGDPEDGHIIMPPAEVWGHESTSGNSWVEEVLLGNVLRIRKNQRRYPRHANAEVIRDGQHWRQRP